MKPADDNDIKKAYSRMDIPEPSEDERKKAVQNAMDEFVRKNVVTEKKSQGFWGLLRLMGKAVRKIFTFKGEPIMTQRQFATIGILVIAVGLIITLGPSRIAKIKTSGDAEITTPEKRQEPQAHDQPASLTDQERSKGLASRTPAPGKEDAGKSTAPKESELNRTQSQYLPEPKSEGTHPQASASTQPGRTDLGSVSAPTVMEERTAGAPMRKMAYESDSIARPSIQPYYQDAGRDKFTEIKVNSIKLVSQEPVSTFSVDVDTASYGFVRRQLNNGLLPQKDSVRVEELINYFDYDYQVPTDRKQPFKPSVAVYSTPWNNNTKLLHIGIKGYDMAATEKPRANLVFLLDVSGSMNSPDKLPLLKNSFRMLVDTLNPEDMVAIAVYAGAAGTVLEPTKAADKAKIMAALDMLQAGGSTAGGEGIRLAYSLAEMNYDKTAVNRVILATDGDFNVGITNQNELKSYIENKRESGVFLSVLGFGQGNYNDALMQTLAQNGNGNAAYIDSLNEARKVLVDEAGSTLFTIAKDVKIQIEFNPDRVHDYRLIGYETRMLNREDFNNDKVDAGDIGSGHTVTAIYEITPMESRVKAIDDLRYGRKEVQPANIGGIGEYAFLKIRYKLPDEDASRLITQPIGAEQEFENITAAPKDMQFAAAVAAFGQILRHDSYSMDFSYDDVLKLAEPAKGKDRFGYRAEFMNLVRLAKTARAM